MSIALAALFVWGHRAQTTEDGRWKMGDRGQRNIESFDTAQDKLSNREFRMMKYEKGLICGKLLQFLGVVVRIWPLEVALLAGQTPWASYF